MFMGWKEFGDSAARYVSKKRAVRRVGRWPRYRPAQQLTGDQPSRQQAHGSTLDIALDARDLASEADMRCGLEAQPGVQQPRAVDEGVAVLTAQAGEGRLLEARDGPEDADLLGMLQLRLEAHHVEERAQRVVLPELHDRPGPPAGARVGEADGLHRAEARASPSPRSAITSIGRQPSK